MNLAPAAEPPSAPLPLLDGVAPATSVQPDEPEEPPSTAARTGDAARPFARAGDVRPLQAVTPENRRTRPENRRDRPPASRRRPRRLAFVCNLRPPNPTPARPATSAPPLDDEFEEFDSPATVDALARFFQTEGYHVTVLEADRTLPRRLMTGHFDLVFNMAEGRGGRCREALVPALCEMLGLHYTGSDPLTLAATLDKAVAKRLVQAEVCTPAWLLVLKMDDLREAFARPDGFALRFPVFAKPNDEGSSKGIRATSRCETPAQLEAICRDLLDKYGRPVLVEEFVRGAEVTVGLVGNGTPEIVGLMHVLPAAGPSADFVYSLDVKRTFETSVRYAIPPELPPAHCEAVAAAALRAFRLLDCRDVARIDFRVDANGTPWFIEANPLPGLSPTSGDLVITARAMGWTWEQLVTRIVRSAEFRQGVLRPMLVPKPEAARRRPALAVRALAELPLLRVLGPARPVG
ncbi:MAG: D-alanine--D-alanine ligase [Myxococcales bacterium]|nr:D-alanine--D-alanine ligase [Myxococcales bacterium]